MRQDTLENHWEKIGDKAVNDFRTFAVARKALSLLGKDPGVIIDVGCGYGIFTLIATLQGYTANGIDVSRRQVQGAHKILASYHLPDTLVMNKSVDDLVAAGSSYESCVMLDVLEHIERPEEILRSVKKIIASTGKLVVSVPAIPAFFDARDKAGGHYLRYDPETLTAHLNKGGFIVDKCCYWNFLGYLIRKFKKENNDEYQEQYEFRYSDSTSSKMLNHLLKSYFLSIENRITPPIGLSLFAVAHPA